MLITAAAGGLIVLDNAARLNVRNCIALGRFCHRHTKNFKKVSSTCDSCVSQPRDKS